MPKRKKKSLICSEPVKSQVITPLPPPNPTFHVTEFIQWLKKRSGVRTLKECKKKWESEGLNIETIVKDLNPYMCVYRRKGEKVVKLENMPWADQCMSNHNLEVPHHSQWKRLEKIISDTERKTKV